MTALIDMERHTKNVNPVKLRTLPAQWHSKNKIVKTTHSSEQGPSVHPQIGLSNPGDDNLGWNKGTTSSEEESSKVSHQSIISDLFAHQIFRVLSYTKMARVF